MLYFVFNIKLKYVKNYKYQLSNIIIKIKYFFHKFKDVGSVTLATMIAIVTLSLFWFYLATVIEPDAYGEISYFISIAWVAATIASLGIGVTITVYGAKKESIHPCIYYLLFQL